MSSEPLSWEELAVCDWHRLRWCCGVVHWEYAHRTPRHAVFYVRSETSFHERVLWGAAPGYALATALDALPELGDMVQTGAPGNFWCHEGDRADADRVVQLLRHAIVDDHTLKLPPWATRELADLLPGAQGRRCVLISILERLVEKALEGQRVTGGVPVSIALHYWDVYWADYCLRRHMRRAVCGNRGANWRRVVAAIRARIARGDLRVDASHE